MSQLLWLDSLGEFLGNFVIREILNVLSIIPKIVYFLVTCLLSVIDMFQVVFRKLAGLDPIILNGEFNKGDSVYKIIIDALFNGDYPAIGTIFWSLVVLGVFMLIVTALLATIRVEYNPDKDKGNSKAGIIKNFLTGLFSLIIIPVASIFAMYLANSLVGVIDTITATATADTTQLSQYFDQWTNEEMNEEMQEQYQNSYIAYDIFGISIPTTQEPFSGTVFKAAAYSCNRFRLYGADYLAVINSSGTDLGIFGVGKMTESKDAAALIDNAFAVNAKIKKGVGNNLVDFSSFLDVNDPRRDYYVRGVLGFFGTTNNVTSFSKYNVEMVWYFYNLWTFNYIVGFVGVIALGKLYATFCLMLMSRIFEIISLFLFAPIVVGIMPIDNGGALGRWRLQYASRFGLVLIMVFGMNMVSPIISILNTMKFFGEPLIDYIVLTIIIVAAMSAVNSLISLLSTILFDKASAYESSMKTAESTSSNLKAGVNATRAVGGGVARVATAPVAWGAKKIGKGVATGFRNSIQSRINARRAAYDTDEMNSVINSVDFNDATNKSRAASTFNSMHSDDRKNLADDFLATDAGKQWATTYFRGNLSEAKDAIAYDGKRGVHFSKGIEGSTTLTAAEKLAAREQVTKFMFDQNNFSKAKTAEGLTKGSAEYNQALNEYHQGSTQDKARAHVGGKYMNSAQQSVQTQRQDYEQRLQTKQQKRRDFYGKVTSGAEKTFKPLASGLQSMIGMIPGMNLFAKDKKDKK